MELNIEHEGDNNKYFNRDDDQYFNQMGVSSLTWEFSSCSSKDMSLTQNSTHFHRCCLKPGYYTLECGNIFGPYGWGSSSITILGQRYCDDFVGYKAMRKIGVFGIFSNFNLF